MVGRCTCGVGSEWVGKLSIISLVRYTILSVYEDMHTLPVPSLL